MFKMAFQHCHLKASIEKLVAISTFSSCGLHVQLCSSCIFECSSELIKYTAIAMQSTFSHILNSKPASSSACFLKSDAHFTGILEMLKGDYNIVVSVTRLVLELPTRGYVLAGWVHTIRNVSQTLKLE